MSSCERLVSSAKTEGSFAEKLNAADPDLLRLHQSVSLLTEQLNLVDILSNPDSVTYGNKSTCDIYQFFHKMVRLFQPRAWDRNIKIRFEGNIYENIKIFNSFQLVPLVLLDNAVKYGDPGSTIKIEYSLRADGLYVDFLSKGKVIPEDEVELVFSRRFRGCNVTAQSSEGSGLGLYIAKNVVAAHGFDISYESRNVFKEHGWNCFTLFIEEGLLK